MQHLTASVSLMSYWLSIHYHLLITYSLTHGSGNFSQRYHCLPDSCLQQILETAVN